MTQHRDISSDYAYSRAVTGGSKSYSRIEQDESADFKSIRIMNDGIIDSIYESTSHAKYTISILLFLLTIFSVVGVSGLWVINAPVITENFWLMNLALLAQVLLCCGVVMAGIKLLPLIFNKSERMRFAFNLTMLKKFDIKHFFLTRKTIENNKINVLALLSIYQNSRFKDCISNRPFRSISQTSFLEFLLAAVSSNNKIYAEIQKENKHKKQIEIQNLDTSKKQNIENSIQDKVRSIYFDK